ncbi:MAG: DNA-binding protein, partial [Armatimonadetes bacterium]|nr:DNA-binding protein [Armatimonadota bacterium]
AAYSEGSRLRELWRLAETELLTSALALEEARRNLLVYCPDGMSHLEELAPELEVAAETSETAQLPVGLDLPDKDRPILAAAIGATCTHLLTGDARHFRSLYGRRVGGVLVLTPAQYLRRRKGRG